MCIMILDFFLIKLEEIAKMSTHFAESWFRAYGGKTLFQHKTFEPIFNLAQ